MRNEIKAGEILELLKQKISGFAPSEDEIEVGRVVQAGDGIAQVWGLDNVLSGELVEVDTGDGTTVSGMVMNLEEETVGIVLFSDYELVKEGCTVRRTNRVAEVPVGEALLGRVVDSLGNPIDGQGPIKAESRNRVDRKGPGIVARQNVREPLQTGIKAIDAMIPIGRGQRELIIGDRRTGKTTIAIDTIINQKDADEADRVYCFYVAIGQKRSSVLQLIERLKKQGVMVHTTVVAATASDPAALQYLAPYSAMAMAEHFRDNGKHALVILDDLTKHAQAYRELSLLMRRSPGREAYPGDVFYLHSRLLERAAKLSDENGGGSLTALPIVETQEGDVSAYIPTNVISITDGQIFLEADLFNSGLRPAINVGISVSRVGGDAQIKAMKQTASSLRIDLAQFRELAAFMLFASDLDAATKKQLDRGEQLTELLKQHQYAPIEVFKQVVILKAGISGRLDKYPTDKLLVYQDELFAYLDAEGAPFMKKLRAAGSFTDELEEEMLKVFDDFEQNFRPESLDSAIDAGYRASLAMAISQHSTRINRDMLKLIERVTSRELSSSSLEEELEDIMTGEDVHEKGRLKDLLQTCDIIESEKSTSMTALFKTVAKLVAKKDGNLSSKEIYKGLVAREDSSSTALSPFFALPHTLVQSPNTFHMVIVRSREGVRFSDSAEEVHAIVFLVGSIDQRHFHLVVISALAQIVNQKPFAEKWLAAKSSEDLRNVIRDLWKQTGK
jgi:F-type H+-transporting ATPase subunit alpha